MLKSLKFKIILSSAICILLVGVFSNVYLYRYLTDIIQSKADHIDKLNLQTVQAHLNQRLEGLAALGSLCAYDLGISRGMRNTEMKTVRQKKEVLEAQEMLQRYLGTQAMIEPYISRLMAFNEDGICAQAVTRVWNSITDVDTIKKSAIFKQLAENGANQIITVAPSVINGSDCILLLSRIYEIPASVQRGWLYIELDPEFIDDILVPYTAGSLFVANDSGVIIPGQVGLPADFAPEELTDGRIDDTDGRIYKIQSEPLKYAGLSLYSRADITFLSADSGAILITFIVVVLASLTTAIVLAVLLSNLITKPLRRLTGRLNRIAENEFTYDPTIERGGDEIAEMGRVVNKMTAGITRLLKETEEMHLQRKNAEIALLQSQVNPHFLYNTLDSIRWLAVIQKNPGIEKTVRSLSNLLKNLAKGGGDKITLEEELSLLRDYVDTQSVRFMELLDFEDRIPARLRAYGIVKFTLQPLVENAIFHGIEPTGECGRILLDAREDGDDLLIFVEDNGVGMTAEELKRLQESPRNPHPRGMAKIGIMNVDSRLKLIYGEDCGLSYESRPGEFTRVTVRVKKEVPDVSNHVG